LIALVAFGACSLSAVWCWRWSMSVNASFYEMVSGKVPAPGSWRYLTMRFNRWALTASSIFFAVVFLFVFIASL
jgi:hypothetical protein